MLRESAPASPSGSALELEQLSASIVDISGVGHTVSLHGLNLALPSRRGGHPPRVLLRDVTGSFVSGSVTAVLGGSGGGKTTLLDIVAGRRRIGTLSGDVLVDGAPPTPAHARSIAYCMQDESLPACATVSEALHFCAEMKLPAGMGRAAKEARCAELIEAFSLRACADTAIGSAAVRGLSGGERRRVAVACAVMGHPRCLLGDELTSGLDSSTAESLIVCVTKLRGCTLILSCHQPSPKLFSCFGALLLLQSGGRGPAYWGAANAAEAFFAAHGLCRGPGYGTAEFLVSLCVDAESDMAALFRASFAGEAQREAAAAAAAATVQEPGETPAHLRPMHNIVRETALLLRWRGAPRYRTLLYWGNRMLIPCAPSTRLAERL